MKYTHKTKGNNDIDLYHFEILKEVDCEGIEKYLYFTTYNDLSGFRPHYSMSDPRDFIMLGVEILANKDYIRNKVKENRKTKVFLK